MIFDWRVRSSGGCWGGGGVCLVIYTVRAQCVFLTVLYFMVWRQSWCLDVQYIFHISIIIFFTDFCDIFFSPSPIKDESYLTT